MVLPPNVKTIGAAAFSGATALKNINLENITSLGGHSFEQARSLETVRIPKANGAANTFMGSGVRHVLDYGINANATLAGYNFLNCNRLETASIKHTQLQQDSFRNCSSLREITFQNVPFTCVQNYAFMGCTSMERINIPNVDGWWTCNFRNESNCIKSYKVNLYVNDEIITGMTSPQGITTVFILFYKKCKRNNIKRQHNKRSRTRIFILCWT